jgi:hypothetical protein
MRSEAGVIMSQIENATAFYTFQPRQFLKRSYHQEKGSGVRLSFFAILLLIALPDFVIAVGCHSNHSFDCRV